jgi:hypothetical protein
MTSNRLIPIETAKNIVISINNNAFVHGLTSNTESSNTEPSTVRCGNKINTENFIFNINFLNYHFNNNK